MSSWQNITDEREKYAAYLCSREWAELRDAVHERSGGTCERCGTHPGDHVHHLTYERKYQENIDDLAHWCRGCHEFVHKKSDDDPAVNSHLADLFIKEARLCCIYCKSKSIFVNQLSTRRGTNLTLVAEIYCDKDHWWNFILKSNNTGCIDISYGKHHNTDDNGFCTGRDNG
jgi:hypothetical protein